MAGFFFSSYKSIGSCRLKQVLCLFTCMCVYIYIGSVLRLFVIDVDVVDFDVLKSIKNETKPVMMK